MNYDTLRQYSTILGSLAIIAIRMIQLLHAAISDMCGLVG